jgi:hypothetical protein
MRITSISKLRDMNRALLELLDKANVYVDRLTAALKETEARNAYKITKVDLNPGDIIVLKFNTYPRMADVERARKHVADMFPGHNVAILYPGVDLSIIAPKDEVKV